MSKLGMITSKCEKKSDDSPLALVNKFNYI